MQTISQSAYENMLLSQKVHGQTLKNSPKFHGQSTPNFTTISAGVGV